MGNSRVGIYLDDGRVYYGCYQTTSDMLASKIYYNEDDIKCEDSKCSCENQTLHEYVTFVNGDYLQKAWTGIVCLKCMSVVFDYKRWCEYGCLSSREAPMWCDHSEEDYTEDAKIHEENYIMDCE